MAILGDFCPQILMWQMPEELPPTPQAPLPIPGPNKNVSALETCTRSNDGYNEVWLK